MKIDQMLESLGLGSEMFDARHTTQIQKTETKKKSTEEKSEIKLVPETGTNNQEQSKKPEIPIRCINCLRKGELYREHYCTSKDILVTWELDKEILCDQFELMKCKSCGLYENGLCTAYDNNIGKSPEDECDYDAKCFM